MGRFNVEIELSNNQDVAMASRGALLPERVRRLKISALVDTGATSLVLPETVAAQLGLQGQETVNVRYGDGRMAKRRRILDVKLELLGRAGVFSAILEPDRPEALVGAIVLEELDLVVDCHTQKLEPRDPRTVTSSIGW